MVRIVTDSCVYVCFSRQTHETTHGFHILNSKLLLLIGAYLSIKRNISASLRYVESSGGTYTVLEEHCIRRTLALNYYAKYNIYVYIYIYYILFILSLYPILQTYLTHGYMHTYTP